MKIAISGLNNTDNPAPGMGVAKGLQKENNLIGLAYDPNEPGIYQDIFEHVYLMPYPSFGIETFLERIEYIKQKSGIEVYIPNLDAELPLCIKHQQKFEDLGIATLLPTIKQFDLRQKSSLADLAKELNVKYPDTFIINSIDDLVAVTKELGFPCMIKGNYYKAYKVHNLDEAIEKFYTISNEWGFPLLLQQIVAGEEINFVGVSSSELYGGFAIKKLQMTDLGKVWSAVTIKNKKLIDLAYNFVEYSGWRGAFELEVLAGGDEIYLIEINPRFPAWVGFGVDIGLNLPKLYIDIMLGKKPQKLLDYPEGKLYMRYVSEAVSDFSTLASLIKNKEL
ncbi:ATP-grasp domain-containing protein [Nitratiruptor sp. YY09-18]|uniref:ATP-grasp domain-containing protein n=1 Tax=Nitratiruptor sp. YY09-18 TaxID=2724901 RepID=UPI001915CCD7|nr:ATP-grasp domain-containing protein [Nitratiruptor sp. YY09-18]BCD67471.1 carbamoyl-phosphate synthase large subunit [Nitratiruptor sp. YY09-18]